MRKTKLILQSLLLVLPAWTALAAEPLTPAEARTIGKEVFLWGMHPVAIYHLRYNQGQNEKSLAYVGMNRLRWYRKPITAADRFATTPNATTLYGTAMLDLSKEPVVITVPEIRDHYWSIQFADNYARWWPLMIGSQFNTPGQLRRLWSARTGRGRFRRSSSGLTSCSLLRTSPRRPHAWRSPTILRRS
jgi:hypothetical protein